MPVHIHVAEQQREVDESLAALGARPIEWLLGNLPVDDRWVLIHATHCTPEERISMANRDVTVGLCPTTEANLGDGFSPLPDYDREDGRWGLEPTPISVPASPTSCARSNTPSACSISAAT